MLLLGLMLVTTTLTTAESEFSKIYDVLEFHLVDLRIPSSVNLSTCCLPGTWIPPDFCLSQCRIFLEAKLLRAGELTSLTNTTAVFRTDVIFASGKLVNSTLDFHINLHEKLEGPLQLHLSLYHQSLVKDTTPLVRLQPLSVKGRQSRKVWTTQTLQTGLDTAPTVRLTVSYRFTCPPDFYGVECERYCAPRDSPLGHYKCDPKDGRIVCLPGWRGGQCTEAICKNGCLHGTCESPGICKCREGWQGEACDLCVPFPGCLHGSCKFNWSLGHHEPFTCECQLGWSGMLCTVDTRYCSNHPETCLNGGVCHNTPTETSPGYACQCPLGYEGYHCETPNHDCRVHRCNGHGICQANGVCACFDNFYGSNCQFNQTDCSHNPCQGKKSTCTLLESPSESKPLVKFRCECQPGLEGRNCEIKTRQCALRPCLHGGKCVELNHESGDGTSSSDGYQCICLPGYRGRHCELSDSACHHLPCANGGVCIDRANRVECRCPRGWTGPTCRQNVNECTTPVCKNGAACRDKPGSYECLCNPGWSGADCGTPTGGNTTTSAPATTLVLTHSAYEGENGEVEDDLAIWPQTPVIVRCAVVASIAVLVSLLILACLLFLLRRQRGLIWRHRKSGFEELQPSGVQLSNPLPPPAPPTSSSTKTLYWSPNLLLCEPSKTEGFSKKAVLFESNRPPPPPPSTPHLIPLCGPSVHHHAIVYACHQPPQQQPPASPPPPPYEELAPSRPK